MKKVSLVLALLLGACVQALAQQQTVDPCQLNIKSSTPINQTASKALFSGAAARQNYICSVTIVTSGSEVVSLVEGTGAVCATSPLALVGAATAASGLALPANGILAAGNGVGTIAAGSNQNFSVCLLQSGTSRLGGVLTYVQQ